MKSTVLRFSLFLSISLLAAGCQQPGDQSGLAAIPDDSAIVFTIGEETVTENMVDAYSRMSRRRSLSELSPEERDRVINDVINVRVASLRAREAGIDKEPNSAFELQFMRDGYLAQALMRRHSEEAPVDDVAIQAAYDARVAEMVGKEYHARHILLRSAEEAEAVIAELDGGAEFAKVAEEKSIGPTARNGGDLGWFTPDRMVKEFSDAVIAMETGSYSKTPVQTQFGFHVILAEESRDAQPPGLDQLRPELKAQLEQSRALEYMESLKTGLTIERVDAPSAE